MGVVLGFCKDFGVLEGGGAIRIWGLVHGGGLLAPKLASLSTASLPNIHERAQMFWSVRGIMCCISCQFMA